jgi:hypothetical protein
MKRAVVLIGAVFGVALAVMIGNRMSADAMGVVVGVVCGVVASIPTSLVLIWALVRRTQGNGAEVVSRAGMSQTYPPVVVVNPGPGYGASGYGPPMAQHSLPAPGGPRSFKVVGDEETVLDSVGRIFPGFADNWGDYKPPRT